MRPVNVTPRTYFAWIVGRLAFAGGTHWALVSFEDGSRWNRLGLGLYWRIR